MARKHRKLRRLHYKSFSAMFDLIKNQPWLESEGEALLGLWNLCRTEAQRELVIDLLGRFKLMSSKELRGFCLRIQEKILNDWNCSSNDTYIVAFSNNSQADGSQALLQILKMEFSYSTWTEKNFINSLPIAVHKCPDKSTIILIDDFIGSGKKVSRIVKWMEEKSKILKKSFNIYIIATAGMRFSKPVLHRLGYVYYVPYWAKKGISESYTGMSLRFATQKMEFLEGLLGDQFKHYRLRNYNFGFNRSESIFAIEHFNTPNNVFPIFWWAALKNGIPRSTILKRL